MLNKGLDEFLAKTSQAMAMLTWETEPLALRRELLSVNWEEVEVGGESTKKVQDVMSAIIPNDSLAFDGGTQLHLLVLLIQNTVSLDLTFRERNPV